MKKTNYMLIIVLPLMWLLYCLFEFFSGKIYLSTLIFLTIFPSLILFIISFLLFKISKYFEHGLSKKSLFFLSLILFIIDQSAKIIIRIFFFKKSFYIISNLLSFNPIINTKGSWLNVRFNININFIMLILINFIALFLFYEIYKYYNNYYKKNFFVDLCYTFIIAGSACSLIDKIFYGGSLDFIGISNLFIADFKDIYINMAIFLFITITFNENNNKIKDSTMQTKKISRFIIDDIKINILKKNN